MSQFFEIHPTNPQPRLLAQAARIVQDGGIIVYPTDTTYGLGCLITNRRGVERISQIKRLAPNHQLSILVADLTDIAHYARVDNRTYRILKRYLPGPYTFVLEATREVPKTLLPRRKTIGLRIPANPTCLGLLRELGAPLLSTSLRLPDQEAIQTDPALFREQVEHQVDAILDGGRLPALASTVVDLTGELPRVLRVGKGDPSPFHGGEEE